MEEEEERMYESKVMDASKETVSSKYNMNDANKNPETVAAWTRTSQIQNGQYPSTAKAKVTQILNFNQGAIRNWYLLGERKSVSSSGVSTTLQIRLHAQK